MIANLPGLVSGIYRVKLWRILVERIIYIDGRSRTIMETEFVVLSFKIETAEGLIYRPK